METSQPSNKRNIKKWLRKIGIAGFLFFLIKGIAWIAITYFIFK